MGDGGLQGWRRKLLAAGLVFTLVLATSLFGIFTRPIGLLAAFWPANAVLLGVFVRWPRLGCASGWAGAVAGYFAADLLTGSALGLTAWLTAANLAGVGVGAALFARVGASDRALRRPLSVLYLFAILICASAASAVVGAGAAPVFFDRGLQSGAAFWFTTELVNGIIVLPVLLTAPAVVPSAAILRALRGHVSLAAAAPLLVLAAAMLAGHVLGGMGQLVFPSPALLWCALVYPLFPTVALTMLVSVWHLTMVSQELSASHVSQIDATTMSDRLGIMLLALGPLTVASINAARMELTARLSYLANHDALTGALARAAFASRGQDMVSAARQPLALMMLDIDHFKLINDRHGHAAGDRALAGFADVVRQAMRKDDLFARIGGEEFALLLPRMPQDGAMEVAERIRRAVEQSSHPLPSGDPIRFTVSIGVAACAVAPVMPPLDTLLAAADGALYRAKGAGRNTVVRATPSGD